MIYEHSGIVQSVEQWTVNPYVTGSSPVARAKISAVFCGFFCFFLQKKNRPNWAVFYLVSTLLANKNPNIMQNAINSFHVQDMNGR